MKKISVIIPCYNVEQYIDRCLTSLEKQTVGMDSLEIICLDDRSTDSTLTKLHEWELKYPDNICIVELPDNGRQGRARNIGVEYASCDWVAFIDSDDWVEPDYLERLYAPVSGCDAKAKVDSDLPDMIICRSRRDASEELSFFTHDISAESKGDRTQLIDTDNKRKELSVLATLTFSAYCKLIRKDFLISHGILFPERLAYEDIYWGSLLPYYVKKVCFVDADLYHYFVNPTSTVLVNNAAYHPDMLTVNMMLWESYGERDLYPAYRDEIEYNFLYTCYLAFIKVLALRYSEPQYSLFKLLQELTRERIPDWRNNRYIRNGDIKEFHMILLELIDKDVNKEDFAQVLEIVRKSGI